ncbi:hypothetical protein [Bradyrhizobium sp. CCBAU 53380]|uniref:hypothetical protein n=1 Tax=Bradyrhizobium sp. CCBAU 53380 TaxID=1325117 RepID=UPI0023023626|nr:hypothetical protein [Bradyrhizobium sp. CCBAU 53380]
MPELANRLNREGVGLGDDEGCRRISFVQQRGMHWYRAVEEASDDHQQRCGGSLRGSSSTGKWAGSRWRLALPVGLLAIPMLAFLTYFFYPALGLLLSSIQTQDSRGIIGRPFTLAQYARLVNVELYARVLWTTLRISIVTSVLATVLAYPVAS